MKKLLTLCLTFSLLGAVGCGDPPKAPNKDKKDNKPAAAPVEEKKADEKKADDKKGEMKTGERENKKDH